MYLNVNHSLLKMDEWKKGATKLVCLVLYLAYFTQLLGVPSCSFCILYGVNHNTIMKEKRYHKWFLYTEFYITQNRCKVSKS